MQAENITLYYREGSSDKVYSAALNQVEGGFMVEFAYGRRGSALTVGTKTATPVEYAKAKKIYDKLVTDKTAKGYTPSESGAAYQSTPNGERVTGILPMLLNAVDEVELESLLDSGAWMMQTKFDGERRMASVTEAGVIGINRKGLEVPLPLAVAETLAQLPAGTVLDGEQVGETLVIFDLLQHGTTDWRERSAYDRYVQLTDLVATTELADCILLAKLATTATAKRNAFQSVVDSKGEGVVFKRMDAPYTVGRPSSGGNALKFKLVESATVEVASVKDGKRSVAVQGYDEAGKAVPLGNVTIPANHPIPAAGAIVEVEYLYAYKGGSLYQPVYKGVRTDQGIEACVLSQLKYKPEVAQAA